MSTATEKKELALEDKMQIVFEAVLEIQKAKTESDAIFQAMLSMEKLNYPNVMISFLKTIDGERFVVADLGFSTGNKWQAIAQETKRSYDKQIDLLPLVLRRRQSRFIIDSRNDPMNENDKDICVRLNIVSQYVMPIATESLRIGTIQVDMGVLTVEEKAECTMLDALAAQLSIAIERHRALAEIARVESELANQAKIIAFDAAAAKIMHELMHSIGDYASRLDERINRPEIRENKEVFEFLRFTQKRVAHWVSSVGDNIRALKTGEQVDSYEVEVVVRQTVDMWHRKAQLRNCTIRGEYKAKGLYANVRLGALRELLSCLIINAIESNAREVSVVVSPVKKTDEEGNTSDHIELAIADNGDGIPLEFKENIGIFGWTLKSKIGHGMGLSIVKLLAERMEGCFKLRSCGKSAGEPRTEFIVCLPARSNGKNILQ